MDAKKALRSAAIYRAGATVSFLIGLGIAALGVFVGGGLPMLRALPPGDPVLNVAHVTNAIPAMILALVGLVVWQFGSTAAHYYTLAAAAGEESAENFDSEKVKSDILAVLDERLAEIHDDVQATRQAVDGGSTATRSGPTSPGSTGGTTDVGSASDGSSGDTTDHAGDTTGERSGSTDESTGSHPAGPEGSGGRSHRGGGGSPDSAGGR